MITTLNNYSSFFFNAQSAPFMMIAMAIALLIAGHILRLSIYTIVVATSLSVLTGWFFSFGNSALLPEETYLGIYVDSISEIGIKLLLPAVLAISIMILQKQTGYHQKVASLLLLLVSCFGAMVTIASHDWMTFFVGLQCLSLPIYGLLAFDTENKIAIASATRYLILSLIAMAFMLFGIVLLYAATGSMDLYEQGLKIKEIFTSNSGLLGLGFTFVLAGAAFKMSLFPFHMWAPDVYQGAALFVVSYMIVVVKSVVLFFLIRCFFLLFGIEETSFTSIISFMAIVSMWIGNGLMLIETNFLRFLAFLSIGHLGFLMIPIAARNALGILAIFLDIAAFGFAILLLMLTIKLIPNRFSSPYINENFKGLLKEYPWHGFALIVSLVSIAGFPLTAGFIGKYAIFASGVDAQLWHLTMHMLLSGMLSLFALVKIVIYMCESPNTASFSPSAKKLCPQYGMLLAGALILLVFGIFPEAWISWAQNHVSDLAYVYDGSK